MPRPRTRAHEPAPTSPRHTPPAQSRRSAVRRLPPERGVFGVPPAFHANGMRVGPFCRSRGLPNFFGPANSGETSRLRSARLINASHSRVCGLALSPAAISMPTTAGRIDTAHRRFHTDPAGRPLHRLISRRALFRSIALAAVAFVALSGCAVRYDGTGTSRVGVGLWGFGDPPGVNWDLDWPRRDVPELPPMRPQELPDRPGMFRTPGGEGRFAELHNRDPRHSPAIDDNRGCDFDGNSSSVSSRVAPPGDAGDGDAAGVWR